MGECLLAALRGCNEWSIAAIHHGWRVGGVVTQRIANPCTPVRFRYSPPKSPWISSSHSRPHRGIYSFALAAVFFALHSVEDFRALSRRNSNLVLDHSDCVGEQIGHMISDLAEAQISVKLSSRSCAARVLKALSRIVKTASDVISKVGNAPARGATSAGANASAFKYMNGMDEFNAIPITLPPLSAATYRTPAT